jgi:hypothetical protein
VTDANQVISGIATKFSARPAIDTWKNANAVTGSSTASAAIVAPGNRQAARPVRAAVLTTTRVADRATTRAARARSHEVRSQDMLRRTARSWRRPA